MDDMQLKTDPEVVKVFEKYPLNARVKMEKLRKLVLQTARETQGISQLEETLKWGEPSYIAKQGSTLRMDWKARSPGQYALYFSCSSRLVPVFRMLYQDVLSFEGSRAIVFLLQEELPEKLVRQCIRAALTYKNVKDHPTLGI